MHEYKLTLHSKDTGENISLSGKFAGGDWECLVRFTQYASELLKTKFVQDGMASSLSINWNNKSGMTVSTKLPPWEDVIVFFHKFRPIGLQSESTCFHNICNVVAKELAHPYIRNMIREQHERYSGKKMQKLFQIKSNDVVLNSEKTLYNWLNSYEYHHDEDKRKLIESLHTILPLEASKAIFIALLSDKAIAIYSINILVKVILGKQKGLTTKIQVD